MKKIVGLMLVLVSSMAFAQSWPQRPVKFICPLGPGSGADITGRLLADRLSKRWGQPVVFENRPGGEGVIAINAVIAANDDHTLLYGPSSSFVGHPYQLEKIPYDPRELQPVARVSSTVVVIAVPTSLNVNSLKDLMAMVRAQPGKMNWSSITGVTDLVIAGYLKGAGLDAVRVPYKNPVAGLTDLVEGRLHFYSSAYAIVRPQAQGGKVKVLAIQNRSRVPGLDFPTVAEAGFPGLNFDGLVGLIAARSSGVPDAVRERIAADVKAELSDPAIVERMTQTGQIVAPGTPAELAAAIDEQAGHLAKFAATLGIKAKQ
ncbi:MAG TPA: tripartite tricarboxylate transporter substrate binding protein [Burkholderiales bacterium]|nr:tripartite tricarboxylate transporter substrate binding protein [Burkholderiales bacterium]